MKNIEEKIKNWKKAEKNLKEFNKIIKLIEKYPIKPIEQAPISPPYQKNPINQPTQQSYL